jgi:hypothetical protein
LAWTSDDLIASAKRRGVIPIAQATWQNADFLAVADEEISGYVLPLIRRVREDYYAQESDFTYTDGAEYRIPYRAAGGVLRSVHFLSASGDVIDVPRVTLDDLEDSRWGVYFFGNVIRVINEIRSDLATLRMIYYLRPSQLVLTAAAGHVASFNAVAKTIELTAAPAAFAGGTSWDIVRGRPGFEMLAFDAAGTLAGTTLTFTGALPTDLAVGDYVCIPEQTPFPQIPAELHTLLVERMILRFCQGQGATEDAQLSASILTRLETDLLSLINQRMGPKQKKILPIRGLWGR